MMACPTWLRAKWWGEGEGERQGAKW